MIHRWYMIPSSGTCSTSSSAASIPEMGLGGATASEIDVKGCLGPTTAHDYHDYHDLTHPSIPKLPWKSLQWPLTFRLEMGRSSGSLCSAGEHPILWASDLVKILKSISKSTEWITYQSRHVFRCSSSTQFWIVLGHLALIIPNLHSVVKGCGTQALWLTHCACQTDSNPRISCGCHWDGLGHNN